MATAILSTIALPVKLISVLDAPGGLTKGGCRLIYFLTKYSDCNIIKYSATTRYSDCNIIKYSAITKYGNYNIINYSATTRYKDYSVTEYNNCIVTKFTKLIIKDLTNNWRLYLKPYYIKR